MKRKIETTTRIKDLPKDKGLGGVKFIYPGDGKAYYWHSQWQKGVWGKLDKNSDQVFPLFCENLTEALEWEVSPEPTTSPGRIELEMFQ